MGEQTIPAAGRQLVELVGVGDLVLIAVLAIAAFVGYRTGSIWQLVATLSAVASLWVTGLYYHVVAPFLAPWLTEPARTCAAVGLVLTGCLAVCALSVFLMRPLLRAVPMSRSHRAIGAAVAVLNAAVLVGVLACASVAAARPDAPARSCLEDSTGLKAVAGWVRYFVPPDMRSKLAATDGVRRG